MQRERENEEGRLDFLRDFARSSAKSVISALFIKVFLYIDTSDNCKLPMSISIMLINKCHKFFKIFLVLYKQQTHMVRLNNETQQPRPVRTLRRNGSH